MLEDRAKVDSFTSFVRDVEPRLRHSLIPPVGLDAATEATAEALAYGWEHWDRLRHMDNPAGYLYRAARTKARQTPNRASLLPAVSISHSPHVEPGLPRALRRLSDKQRTVVWLVYGLEWQQREVADLLGVSEDTVRTHLSRGMTRPLSK
jgi:RNA polymerase sigma-70 factor (ECF subfamily)